MLNISKMGSRSEAAQQIFVLTGDHPDGHDTPSWKRFSDFFGQNYGITYFDFSGLGRSDGSAAELTLSQGAEDWQGVFESEVRPFILKGVPVHAVGYSFGASVFLSAPDIANSFESAALRAAPLRLQDAYVAEIGLENLRSWILTGKNPINQYGSGVFFDACAHDLYTCATRIVCPILLVGGSEDAIVPPTEMRLLNELLQASILEMMDGVGHGLGGDEYWPITMQLIKYHIETTR